jgi:surface protein
MTDDMIKLVVYQWVTKNWFAKVKYGDISNWDTSRITNMDNLFGYQNPYSGYTYHPYYNYWSPYWVEYIPAWNQNFNADLSQWDTSRVTSVVSMFDKASSFNSDISSWNTSQVTIMKRVFYSASVFDVDLSPWNISQVTSMTEMFYTASAFNQSLCWDVSKVVWDVSHALPLEGLFDGNGGSLNASCLVPSYTMTDDMIKLVVYQWVTKNWFAKVKYGDISN